MAYENDIENEQHQRKRRQSGVIAAKTRKSVKQAKRTGQQSERKPESNITYAKHRKQYINAQIGSKRQKQAPYRHITSMAYGKR